MFRVAIIGALLLPFAAMPAAGAGITDVSISGTSVSAELAVGGYEADLTLSFPQAVGLSAASLGLSAAVVNPVSMSSRLPSSLGTGVAVGFPVLLSIEPPSDGALSFSGAYELELYTHDLAYVAGSPLRLFRAEDGGPFVDVTAGAGAGSYRVRGHGGGFSEFMIVVDTRSAATAIAAKYDRLDDLLDLHAEAIDASLLATLDGLLAASLTAWGSGSAIDAADAIDDFLAAVEAAEPSALPDTWRSSRDLVNVAGELYGAASTLRFGLAIAP